MVLTVANSSTVPERYDTINAFNDIPIRFARIVDFPVEILTSVVEKRR